IPEHPAPGSNSETPGSLPDRPPEQSDRRQLGPNPFVDNEPLWYVPHLPLPVPPGLLFVSAVGKQVVDLRGLFHQFHTDDLKLVRGWSVGTVAGQANAP